MSSQCGVAPRTVGSQKINICQKSWFAGAPAMQRWISHIIVRRHRVRTSRLAFVEYRFEGTAHDDIAALLHRFGRQQVAGEEASDLDRLDELSSFLVARGTACVPQASYPLPLAKHRVLLIRVELHVSPKLRPGQFNLEIEGMTKLPDA
ncbi:uncharacterized protein L969DRAFT_95132 [Mixia osmundae IAM 14324]|uniref:Uncharacterized protein n=1 Tax=Mixia osmundae (strain CBS 9802 / IAM 14324 / JCM 22182 / KY 12970) TaxID=764103 RepID=G7E732_MIXOS|nr:uncharacterized protein L969DRAFT_95132 [Mixia osmundae IAM 14324]KEI38975.1 hypothetical protein L969DRAFT_95132 [Mixia osmundae IAM 14324]GAA98642.1 hypothetical protein E5Q_05329 [Mixia osmundae IAM 14324]